MSYKIKIGLLDKNQKNLGDFRHKKCHQIVIFASPITLSENAKNNFQCHLCDTVEY